MSELQQTIGQLSMSLWGLSAFSSALEAGLVDELVEPASSETIGHRTGVSGELVERLLDVLVAIGVVRLESVDRPTSQCFHTSPGKRGPHGL